jgi:hypothetical protein
LSVLFANDFHERNTAATFPVQPAVMALFRLRVELPDRPGALAHVAARIAESGASVVSLEIHELAGNKARDEIVVDGPSGWSVDVLAAALTSSGVATVLAAGPASELVDPVVDALEWAIARAEAGPEDADSALGCALLAITEATAAWVTDVAAALEVEAGRLALERRGPVVVQTEDDVWMLAVPDGQLDTRIVAFAARPLDAHFSVSEIARVGQLVRLHRQLLRQPVG